MNNSSITMATLRSKPARFFILALLLIAQQAVAQAAPLHFTVTYDAAITNSFTGRVYLMFTAGREEPRFGPDWFNPQPYFALDVKNWKPDTPLTFDDQAIGFPGKLSEIPPGEYRAQAVMRRNLDSPSIGAGEGTAYSAAAAVAINAAAPAAANFTINQVAKERQFPDSERIKVVELKSDLLSDFYHRDINMRAAVMLPKGYDDNKDRRYPAMYWIGGFGSDHRSARFMTRGWAQTGFDDQIVRVVLDPSCYGGHHVFANSANNGPRGDALVKEFIPYLERTYRLVSSPSARFLSGHSSGGWSSLWLQTAYPEFFGGTWSVAPDPVDFRDFQRIDLYQPGVNMYIDEQGNPRPLARMGEQVVIWYEQFAKMEVVYGEGGQLRSFEWVFSPRDSNGLPKPLYDRNTGLVDSEVAEYWKRYDIRLILEQNWTELAPKLEGGSKIHVFTGDLDTFYLDGAARLLKQSQEKLGSKATVILEPGKDHGSIATGALRKRIDSEMMQTFTQHHPEFAPEKYAKEQYAR